MSGPRIPRRDTPTGSRAVHANARRLQRERSGRMRRVDAVVTPDAIAFRSRASAVLLVFGLVWAAILGRAAWLTLGFDQRLTDRLESQHERIVTIAPQRGSILDRLGRPLAVSVELGSVYADPSMVKDPAAAAELLAPLLDIDAAVLHARISKKGRFVWLARQVPTRVSDAVTALGIDGIALMAESHREYPSGSLASQVLGFVGIDGNGLEGMEARYESQLMGDSFRYRVLRDGRRRATNYEAVLARRSTEGNTLVLTLDHSIQHRAEMALDAAVLRHAATGGFVIVMDVNTGGVLAAASSPRFDPNAFRGVEPQAFKNLGLSMNFEPGSTMKAFVVAEVLEAGLATPETTVYCEKGAYRIGRNVVHDTHPQEWLTLADVVKLSSNIGTVKIAEELGPARLEAVLRRFGFGSRTGIDLYGEESGILHPSAGWARITFATHAFGQGLAVTGVQMAAGYSALVNGGLQVKPHVLAEVRDRSGEVVADYRPTEPGIRLLSEETSATLRPMLGRVLEKDGTGWRAVMGEYTAGGKTGTAQKVKDGRYAPGAYVSSFIGFAPVDAPRIVTFVALDEPTNKYYGGTVAGPVFSEVTSHALRALGVAPDKLGDHLALAALTDDDDDDDDDDGDGSTLPELVVDGTGWLIPDLRGLSARDAVLVLGPAGAAVQLAGTGLVSEQTPAPGAWIAEGDAVAIALLPRTEGGRR